jgi:tetratricopeptide (TPR) repeat protein
MPGKISDKICAIPLLLVLGTALCPAQVPIPRPKPRPAPPTAASIDGSEAMFATMCALYAAGYESDINPDNWSAYRSQMRQKLRLQHGPAVDALKEFYRGHQFRDPASMLSRFVWFGLISGPAPKFRPVLRRDELPPDVLDLEGFSDILSNYYTEQNIAKLWKDVQPLYEPEIQRLHDPVSEILFQSNGYVRAIADPTLPKSFSIVVEPLVGRITNVRNFVDHYAIVLSGSDDVPVDVVRHAYLHFLLDGLPLQYPHVIAVKRPLYDKAAKAPRLAPDLKDDFPSWFGECTVRAVEIKLKKLSPGEQEAALQNNDTDGYVLVRPIFLALSAYEKQDSSFRDYFPGLIRAIDEKTEETRVVSIQYAPVKDEGEAKELNVEVVARNRARISTLPPDPEAIAALTEGEKSLSEKNPRAAEVSFKSVLAKYPDQPRAWYGLGMVAVLDHDAERAKEVFGRLTSGQFAASHDPLVLAWSHIYLARILEDEGQLDQAKAEYQAVLAVPGAPPQAQQAAQKGLGDLDLRKPSERP